MRDELSGLSDNDWTLLEECIRLAAEEDPASVQELVISCRDLRELYSEGQLAPESGLLGEWIGRFTDWDFQRLAQVINWAVQGSSGATH